MLVDEPEALVNSSPRYDFHNISYLLILSEIATEAEF